MDWFRAMKICNESLLEEAGETGEKNHYFGTLYAEIL